MVEQELAQQGRLTGGSRATSATMFACVRESVTGYGSPAATGVQAVKREVSPVIRSGGAAGGAGGGAAGDAGDGPCSKACIQACPPFSACMHGMLSRRIARWRR